MLTELANFCISSGDFFYADSLRNRYHMDPERWWVLYGGQGPIIQSLALKLLVQPAVIAIKLPENNIDMTVTIRHNEMTPQRAKDLVFVHSKLRYLSRRNPCYMKGETKLWDIAGDSFDSFEDVGILEVANLSLDELDLETMVFTDVSEVVWGGKDKAVLED